MIRTLLAIKLHILRNSFRGSKFKLVAGIVVYVAAIAGGAFSALRLAQQAGLSDAKALEAVMLQCTILFGIWVFGPLLVGGVDDGLDPTRLALLPLTRREMRLGLCGAALLGPLPLATLITLLGFVVSFGSGMGKGAVIAGAGLLLLFNLTASRALSVGLAFASRSRKGKDLSVLVASVCAAAIFLGTQSLRFLRDDQKDTVLRAMRWLPTGQIGIAMLEADSGRVGIALLRLSAVALLSMVLAVAWLRGIDRLLVDTETVRHGRRASVDGGLGLLPAFLRRFSHRPTMVLISKELRYLVRSPARRSSMVVSIVIGTVFALMQSLRFNSANVYSVFGSPIAMLFGVHATNNLLGTDSASLWLEQTAGIRLKRLLIARGVAATPNLVVPTVLAAFVLAVMTQGWLEFFLVASLSLLCWGVALGVGSVVSIIAPFSQPDSDNPHSNRRANAGNGALVSVFAVVGITALLGLSLPIVALVMPGYLTRSAILLLSGIAASAIYAMAIWWIGLSIALRVTRKREVDLLASIGGRRAVA